MPIAASEYNDVDSRLLRKAVDSGLDAFLCDANEAIELKLVRDPKDVDDEEATFNPEMSHQVYGENESIFGYKDLRIKVCVRLIMEWELVSGGAPERRIFWKV